MCTHSPIAKTVSAYLTEARLLLGGLHCDDYHAHGLALQRLVRFIPGVAPSAVDLTLAQAIVALEAGYASWDELEHNAEPAEVVEAPPMLHLQSVL